MHPLTTTLLFTLGATAATIDTRQSTTPLVGTCTVADNKCTVMFPLPDTPYNFTCGLVIAPAVPAYVYEPARCTVEGHVCNVWPSIFTRSDCGCGVDGSC